ncbi:MAG: cysteine hydrolase family protein [Anaerolineae bacterium]
MQLTPQTALLLIDVQVGLDDPALGQRNNPQAEPNIARLLAEWRAHQRPIYHVQHMSTSPQSPLRPEQAGNAIKDCATPLPHEPLVQKSVNSAFIGTDLEARLRADGIESLLIVGLTTNHCVSTTTRMASNLGFTSAIVADATACHAREGFDGVHYDADTVHRLALVSLQDEFAEIVHTDDLLKAR